MKNKLLLGLTVIIAILLVTFCSYKIEAYSGDIAPTGYITISNIIITNSIGKGTITLSSELTDYTISYQKIDITQDQFDNMKAKLDAGDNEGAIALAPDYTSSWTQTTNTTDNVQLDFTGKTSPVNFILWVKITNETNTYYTFNIFSSALKTQDETDTPPSTDEETTDEWTDFSKAKFELKKDGTAGAMLEISEITPEDNHTYALYISSNSNKPNITKETKELITLVYDTKDKKLKTLGFDEMASFVELNQDIYITILETNESGKNNIVLSGKKIEKYTEPQYSDGFFATFLTNEADQIVTNFTHSKKNDRKMQIKIGKITDKSILQKIKNKNSSGFSDLLKFAKSNSAIYNQTVNADKDTFSIQYNAGSSVGNNSNNPTISLKGLENEAYYYLYVKTDDENGKYISNEAVTLALSNTYTGGWGMFFYGDDDFEWADFGENSGDTQNPSEEKPNLANGTFPKTGLNFIIFSSIVVVLAISGIVAYKKYKKYNF